MHIAPRTPSVTDLFILMAWLIGEQKTATYKPIFTSERVPRRSLGWMGKNGTGSYDI